MEIVLKIKKILKKKNSSIYRKILKEKFFILKGIWKKQFMIQTRGTILSFKKILKENVLNTVKLNKIDLEKKTENKIF